jgi:lysophospholipid acyltransferase (LPLAT)-like uncharacterized protein
VVAGPWFELGHPPRFSEPGPAVPLARRWLLRLLGAAGALIGILWRSTWTVRRYLVTPDGRTRDLSPHRFHPGIHAIHHNVIAQISLCSSTRRYGALISVHGDGEVVAQMSGWLGFLVVRGSSRQRSAGARRELEAMLLRGVPTAVMVDGPTGPRYEVKLGVVATASRVGCPIVPVATVASQAWQLPTWDRFGVPLPFARVLLLFGRPVWVPPGLGREELERYRLEVEDAILHQTNRLQAVLGLPASERARRLAPGEPARPPRGQRRVRTIRRVRGGACPDRR